MRRATRHILRRAARAAAREDGNTTIEFVILFPLIFAIFLTSVDFSLMMLRQVFLERAVDIAVRDVRLGRIPANGFDTLRQRVCENTALTPNCMATITIELRPMTAAQFASLDPTATCINRAEEITPVLDFNPGTGQQELMMMRVCTVSNPIIFATGLIFGGPRNANDDRTASTITVFANEPT